MNCFILADNISAESATPKRAVRKRRYPVLQ